MNYFSIIRGHPAIGTSLYARVRLSVEHLALVPERFGRKCTVRSEAKDKVECRPQIIVSDRIRVIRPHGLSQYLRLPVPQLEVDNLRARGTNDVPCVLSGTWQD